MTQQDKIKKLRNKLIESLKSDELDFGKVLDMSSQLARLDPENVRFSIDAGHISRLGRELVGRQETAVSELVKNAFDADAKSVDLIFENCDQPGGRLTIVDNGHGMTRPQLVDGFMRISTTDKIHEPVSQWYKRQRAGRKGIGRFAAQRLGSKLTLITQAKDDKKALKINIDWDNFVGDKELIGITSHIDEISKTKHGTSLIIDDLQDGWSDSQIRRIYRYVADLIQPYPLSKESSKRIQDPGFKANFYRLVDGKKQVIADEKTMTFDHALAVIEGRVDFSGKGYWSVNSKLLKIKEKSVAIGPLDKKSKVKKFIHLRDVRFKAHYFIYDADLLPGQQMPRIQELARIMGGIRVYRNGFRVLPYGEPNDDWLKLDASTRARSILPPHANNNFFGFVELKDSRGERFEETSSREGLIVNESLEELSNFIARSLKAAVLRIASVREKKQTTGQADWKPKEKPTDKVRNIASSLEKIASGAADKDKSASTNALAETLKATADEQDRITQTYLEEIGMLRVLASLGLTIGQFTHEIRHYLPALRADLELFVNSKLAEKVHKTATRMDSNLKTLNSYTAYFDKSVSENVHRELKSHDLIEVINNFVDMVRPLAKRAGIEIPEPEIEDYDLATRPMHPSEWASILFNLYSNSKKAIRRAGASGRILIRVGKTNGYIFLEFIDNGDGIPSENVSRIFDAFFTTTPPSSELASEDDEIAGTGLGLKIIKDIITSSHGTITVEPAPKGFSTCFRIEIPAAAVEED